MAGSAAGLSTLFQGLRPRSAMSLDMGVAAKNRDGVSATLVIQIPASKDKPAEVFLSTAPSSLVAELWKLTE